MALKPSLLRAVRERTLKLSRSASGSASSRLAASIDHANVIPIYEAGQASDGTLFIAMRYVEGADLKQVLRQEGALEPDRAVQLLAQAARGLDAAHARGLIHRDVKPSNVLVATSEGDAEHVYLADFGLTQSASSPKAAKDNRNNRTRKVTFGS